MATSPRPATPPNSASISSGRLIDESKDKLADADKPAVRAAIETVNVAKKGEDPAAINRDREPRPRQPGDGRAPLRRLRRGRGRPDRRSTRRSRRAGRSQRRSPKADDVIDVEFEVETGPDIVEREGAAPTVAPDAVEQYDE